MRTSSETHKADALCDLSRKTHTRAHTHGRTYSFSHTHSSSRSRCFVPPIQQDTHTHAHKNTQSSSSTRCAIHASTSAIAPHSRWHSFRPCAQLQPFYLLVNNPPPSHDAIVIEQQTLLTADGTVSAHALNFSLRCWAQPTHTNLCGS